MFILLKSLCKPLGRLALASAAAMLAACVSTQSVSSQSVGSNNFASQSVGSKNIDSQSEISSPTKTVTHSGRFTVTYQNNGEDAREQGSFEWRVEHPLNNAGEIQPASAESAMQLFLKTPLGNTVAAIEHTPKAVEAKRYSLRLPDRTEEAGSFDELMQRTLRWTLPLPQLLTMLNTTDSSNKNNNSSNNNNETTTGEWVINISSRHDNQRPKLVIINRNNPKIAARLVFEE